MPLFGLKVKCNQGQKSGVCDRARVVANQLPGHVFRCYQVAIFIFGDDIDLFGFTGLCWSEQTEQFIRASTGREDGAFHSVFKNPAHSATKWKQELGQEEIRRIIDVVRDSLPGRWLLDA